MGRAPDCAGGFRFGLRALNDLTSQAEAGILFVRFTRGCAQSRAGPRAFILAGFQRAQTQGWEKTRAFVRWWI